MRIEKRRLANGLRIFFAHMPGARTVCVAFVVRAGWMYEREGVDVGVAHFLEHMASRGTSARPTSKDISIEIEEVGGRSNAYTDTENILYFVHVPAKHALLAAEVVSDIVSSPLLRENDIEIEKGAVKEEFAGIFMSSEAMVHEVFLGPLLFGNHPLGWIGTGDEEQIDAIDRNLLLNYMQDLFTTQNCAVVCAGNIENADQLVETIASRFENFPVYSPRRKMKRYKDDQAGIRLKLARKKVEQTLLCLAVKQAPVRDRYALAILETILGSGMSSRLFLNVRDRLGLVYDIHSYLDIHKDVAILSVFAGIDLKRWRDGLRAMIEEMRLLRQEGIGEDELKKAKEILCAKFEFLMESPGEVASGLADSWALFGKTIRFDLVEKRIRSVTADDVSRVADGLFRSAKLNCVALGPSLGTEKEVRNILNSLG